MNILSFLIATYLSVTLDISSVNSKDLECMVQNIYHESRGEDTVGHIHVAQTVRNRIRFGGYGNDACSVIWSPGQFSWTFDRLPDAVVINDVKDAEFISEIINISALALSGAFDGIMDGATHYYAHNKVTPCFKDAYDDFLIIGNHTWGLSPNSKTPCYDQMIASRK